MKKYDYISAAAFIALACYIFYETSGYKIGAGGQKNPAIWPQFLAGCLVLLAVLLVVTTFFKKQTPEEAAEHIDWTTPGMIRAYIAIAVVLAFLVVMYFFGMLVAILLLCPCIMALMNTKSKIAYIALPVGVTLFVYVFFARIMTITLPAGKFF